MGVPRRIAGRYRLDETLGQGGMAVVWKAHDERLNRWVAVKVLPPAFAADNAAERLAREAHALGSVWDPRIVAVFDYGVDEDDTVYVVMEYVDGRTLEEIVDDGPTPPDVALEWMIEVCRALEATHDAHILHRDIKPSNILVTVEGHVKLVDFGIAAFVAGANDRARLTARGRVVGTRTYMAPEHRRGAELDERADLYAVGCVLYQLVTGDSPAEDRRELTRVPAALRDAVAVLVAPARDERPPSATHARELLEAALNEGDAEATSGTWGEADAAAEPDPFPREPVALPERPQFAGLARPDRHALDGLDFLRDRPRRGGAAVDRRPRPTARPALGASRRRSAVAANPVLEPVPARQRPVADDSGRGAPRKAEHRVAASSGSAGSSEPSGSSGRGPARTPVTRLDWLRLTLWDLPATGALLATAAVVAGTTAVAVHTVVTGHPHPSPLRMAGWAAVSLGLLVVDVVVCLVLGVLAAAHGRRWGAVGRRVVARRPAVTLVLTLWLTAVVFGALGGTDPDSIWSIGTWGRATAHTLHLA